MREDILNTKLNECRRFQRKLVLMFNNTDDKGEEDFRKQAKTTIHIMLEEDRRVKVTSSENENYYEEKERSEKIQLIQNLKNLRLKLKLWNYIKMLQNPDFAVMQSLRMPRRNSS